MGRKNEIEGQLNFLDMLVGETSINEEQEVVDEPIIVEKVERDKIFHPGGFSECTACWCATCEHSSVGGSVPRPFGENTRPCPSCELCVSEGKADVCVIGSADEGCRYRAEKDGLLSDE